MSSMFDNLMGALGNDNLGAIMGMLGGPDETPDEDTTKKAIGAGLGAILGGLANNAQQPSGAESLFNAVTDKHDGGILDNLGDFLGMGGDLVDGGKILGHVFGDNRTQVESQVAQAAGVKQSLMAKLLPMLAPMVLGWIGRKIASGGLRPNDMGNVLQQERQQVERTMPDLGDLLGGLGGLLGGGSPATTPAPAPSGGGLLNMLKNLLGGSRR